MVSDFYKDGAFGDSSGVSSLSLLSVSGCDVLPDSKSPSTACCCRLRGTRLGRQLNLSWTALQQRNRLRYPLRVMKSMRLITAAKKTTSPMVSPVVQL